MHNLRPRQSPVCIDDAAPLVAMHLSSKTAKQNAQPPLSPAKPSKRSKKTKVATPAKTGKKSQYRGVSRRASGKWTAQLCHRGKNEDLGKFDDEKSAARAYDARARELGMHSRCNFDEDDEPPPQRNVQGGTGYSQFLGVTYQKGKYQAQIRVGPESNEYLGRFDDERDAARAYDVRAKQLGKECNFPDGGDDDDVAAETESEPAAAAPRATAFAAEAVSEPAAATCAVCLEALDADVHVLLPASLTASLGCGHRAHAACLERFAARWRSLWWIDSAAPPASADELRCPTCAAVTHII